MEEPNLYCKSNERRVVDYSGGTKVQWECEPPNSLKNFISFMYLHCRKQDCQLIRYSSIVNEGSNMMVYVFLRNKIKSSTISKRSESDFGVDDTDTGRRDVPTENSILRVTEYLYTRTQVILRLLSQEDIKYSHF